MNYLLLLLATTAGISAQTVLVGPAIRNGGFEEADGTNFATTPYWESYFPEGDTTDPVLNTFPNTGSLRGFANGYQGTGNRIHPTQTIPLAEGSVTQGGRP